MTHLTKDLPQGIERGFRWVRVIGDNGMTFHFTFPPGEEIPETVSFDSYYTSHRGPFPFSDGDIEESTCLRHVSIWNDGVDWSTWLDGLLPRPEGCDIRIASAYYEKDIWLHATTYRRGRIETVTRKLDGSRDLLPQAREAYAYFERNCPAPTAEEREHVAISTIGQALLDHVLKEGLDMLREWHADSEERLSNRPDCGLPSLSIDGMLVKGHSIRKITFTRRSEHRQILVGVEFEDGHSYQEDEKGATTLIKGEYADALVIGAKGRKLSCYLGMPGADSQTVRTSRTEHDKISTGSSTNPRMRLRTSVANVALEIPQGEEEPDEDVMSHLDDLIGPHGYFSRAEAGIMTHLEKFTPRVLRRVLTILKAENRVDLEDHGGPDIRLKSPGGYISIDFAREEKLPHPREIYGERS